MYMKLFGIKITLKMVLIATLVIVLASYFLLSSNTLKTNLKNVESIKDVNSNPDKLTILDDSKFKPECCPSTYSSSNGCLCLDGDEEKMLETRGGNKLQCV